MKRARPKRVPARALREAVLVFLCTIFALSSRSPAQQQSASPPEWKDIAPPGFEAFELKYIPLSDFQEMLRELDLYVEEMRSYKKDVIFLRFRDDAVRERAVKLHRKIDVPPKRIGLHFLLVRGSDAPAEGYQTLSDQALRNRLSKTFRFGHYQIVDGLYLALNSHEKGDVYFGGRYKATFKAIFIDDGEGVVKLHNLTLRDLDLGPILDRAGSGATEKRKTYPRSGADTRLLKTVLNVGNGATEIVGSSNMGDPGIAFIVVVTARVLN